MRKETERTVTKAELKLRARYVRECCSLEHYVSQSFVFSFCSSVADFPQRFISNKLPRPTGPVSPCFAFFFAALLGLFWEEAKAIEADGRSG